MSFSLVPGFAQRYPQYDDGPSWLDDLLIETCCTTLDEALAAEAHGADRIELCTDLSVGGLTPPRELIREVIDKLSIPVNILIRPSTRDALWHCLTKRLASLDPSHASHGPLPLTVPRVARFREAVPPALGSRVEESVMPGSDRASEIDGFSAKDFVYDEDQLRQMIEDIDYCKSVGAAGIVVGALTPEGAVDRAAMRRLIDAAQPLPVTFHRAFDVCTGDPYTTLDQLIALGCTRLLTSGQAPTAWEGRGVLALLVRRAAGRIIIMPGCGITPDNFPAIAAYTRAPEYHGTAIP